eukprot:TRINITY_DN13605_c0_g1_i1.p1 TRINITY_DN13605_c0_g1~~TRINITY_DN13605_c0_g1_i1.p1  ORF type:complete len:344 (+),score=44.43 TRINITY_DN13605_c0_g1_i1:371-1402(+)
MPSRELAAQLQQQYLGSISASQQLSSADFPLQSADSWLKSFQALNTLEPTFVQNFIARLVPSITQNLLYLDASAAIAALLALHMNDPLQNVLPDLCQLQASALLKFGRILRVELESLRLDPLTIPFYHSIVSTAHQKQRAFVDYELRKFTASLPRQMASWPCGSHCNTCGYQLCNFLQSNADSIVWKCKFVSKHCIRRDSSHVQQAASKAGVKCEGSGQQLTLTKSSALIRAKQASLDSSMLPYTELIRPGDARTHPVAQPPNAPPAPAAQKARPDTAFAQSLTGLRLSLPSLIGAERTPPSSRVVIDLSDDPDDAPLGESDPKRRLSNSPIPEFPSANHYLS